MRWAQRRSGADCLLWTHISSLASEINCENLNGRGLALYRHRAQGYRSYAIWQCTACVLIDQNFSPGNPGVRLQACRDVDRISDTGVRGALLRARIPRHDVACSNADADADCWPLRCAAFYVELFDELDHFQRRGHG